MASTLDDDDGPPGLEVADSPERPDDAPDKDTPTTVTAALKSTTTSTSSTEAAGSDTKTTVAQLELNKQQDAVYHLNLGHQEMERILGELEANCEVVLENAGTEAWMPVDGIEQFVFKELGYEDREQFNDALGGTFQQFCKALPHMETKIQDDGSSCDGKLVVRMIPPPTIKKKMTLKLTINKSEDLWRTLYKAPDATIEIPELEFQIGASEKRQLEAIFNHVTNAMFNLTQHARQGGMSGDGKEKVLECCEQLSELLDIPHPWEIIVHDPSGRSLIKPDTGVEVIWDDAIAAAETA